MRHELHIDTHVHLYDCFNLKAWVQHALTNLNVSESVQGALIVVDRQGQDSLTRLRREVPEFAVWEESPISEGLSIGIIHYCGRELFIVPGVQYVTSERLEVLALGSTRLVSDGVSIETVIEKSLSVPALVCLPWSPGKWLGKRGRCIRSIVSNTSSMELCLGDISVHGRFWPKSVILNECMKRGFACFAGTDALNRPKDCKLVGSFGVSCNLEGPISAQELIYFVRSLSTTSYMSWGRPNGFFTSVERFISSFL
jgi:hypothetical protein